MPDQTTTDTAAERAHEFERQVRERLVGEGAELTALASARAVFEEMTTAQDAEIQRLREIKGEYDRHAPACLEERQQLRAQLAELRAKAVPGEAVSTAHPAPVEPHVWRENGRWCWRALPEAPSKEPGETRPKRGDQVTAENVGCAGTVAQVYGQMAPYLLADHAEIRWDDDSTSHEPIGELTVQVPAPSPQESEGQRP